MKFWFIFVLIKSEVKNTLLRSQNRLILRNFIIHEPTKQFVVMMLKERRKML